MKPNQGCITAKQRNVNNFLFFYLVKSPINSYKTNMPQATLDGELHAIAGHLSPVEMLEMAVKLQRWTEQLKAVAQAGRSSQAIEEWERPDRN